MRCPLLQTNKKLAKSNQEQKPFAFGVNTAGLFCTSGFKRKDIEIQEKLYAIPDQLVICPPCSQRGLEMSETSPLIWGSLPMDVFHLF